MSTEFVSKHSRKDTAMQESAAKNGTTPCAVRHRDDSNDLRRCLLQTGVNSYAPELAVTQS